MPVGVVAGAAAVEPEDLLDAEVIVEGLFELSFGDTGISLLDVGEEALFCGDNDACAVSVYAAAFENEAMLGAVGEGHRGLRAGHGVEVGNVLRDPVVVQVVGVLGPGVELPIGDGDLVLWVLDEDGTGVAEPDAVGAPDVEVQASEIGALTAKHAVGALFAGDIVDEDVHIFHAGEMADDLAVDPGDGLELAGPVLGIVGPGDPCGGVRGPFGGHAEAGGH